MLTRVLLAGVLVLAVAAGSAQAQEAYVELMRQDIKTQKVAIITAVMDFTDEEAKIFWPLYREYGTELAKIGDRRIAMIKAFAETYGSITDEQATLFAKDWFALHSDRLKLRKKYFDKVSKAVSPLIAAQFIQLENVVGMLIDIQVAAELPLME